MKHIHKGAEPIALTEWNIACAGAATSWDERSPEVNGALQRALVAEQGQLCAYCGRRIVQGDYHIEHLVPRNGPMGTAALTFVYQNLVASCQANLARRDPRHCGSAKGDWYDAALFVSPLDPGCEARFAYDLDGKVRPFDPADEGARETIARLDLDGARLRGLRRGAIDALFEHLDHDLLPEECDALLAAFARRDASGRFDSFCFVLIAALRALHGAP
jgi:uncharacterized protein (TIGR02646 family)